MRKPVLGFVARLCAGRRFERLEERHPLSISPLPAPEQATSAPLAAEAPFVIRQESFVRQESFLIQDGSFGQNGPSLGPRQAFDDGVRDEAVQGSSFLDGNLRDSSFRAGDMPDGGVSRSAAFADFGKSLDARPQVINGNVFAPQRPFDGGKFGDFSGTPQTLNGGNSPSILPNQKLLYGTDVVLSLSSLPIVSAGGSKVAEFVFIKFIPAQFAGGTEASSLAVRADRAPDVAQVARSRVDARPLDVVRFEPGVEYYAAAEQHPREPVKDTRATLLFSPSGQPDVSAGVHHVPLILNGQTAATRSLPPASTNSDSGLEMARPQVSPTQKSAADSATMTGAAAESQAVATSDAVATRSDDASLVDFLGAIASGNRAALLTSLPSDLRAVDAALDELLGEIEGLGGELATWLGDSGLSTANVAAGLALASSAAGMYIHRTRFRQRPADESEAASSSWVFTRLQNSTGLSSTGLL